MSFDDDELLQDFESAVEIIEWQDDDEEAMSGDIVRFVENADWVAGPDDLVRLWRTYERWMTDPETWRAVEAVAKALLESQTLSVRGGQAPLRD